MQQINHSRIPIRLQNQVLSCLRQYLSLANRFFHTEFFEPKIEYKNKGSIAGSALLNKWQIQLNRSMLIENQLLFINEVIPHELAHLITFKQYGQVKPHGPEWQYVMMTVFNCQPKRTHRFVLPSTIQKKRYRYTCQCQTHLLTTIRHNRIQNRHAKYFCKSCHALLQLDKNDSNNPQ